MNICRKYLLFRVKDVYFSPCACNLEPLTDVTRFFQCAERFDGSETFHTLHIGLQHDDETLFKSFDRRTRAELRKTVEPGLFVVERHDKPTDGQLDEFIAFFNSFALEKHIAECDRTLLENTRDAGCLMISATRSGSDATRTCCMHAHSSDKNRARAIYSCSGRFCGDSCLTGNLVAKANRLLHFDDMKYYRDLGVPFYDFGGLSLSEDPDKKGVDEFKRGFGGQVVEEFNGCLAHNGKGRMMLLCMKARNRMRQLISR